jgi:glucose-1-phosphate thymidylyltransferase
MKGIILAGGHGTRLHPLTLGVSKQLLPVYDKPMVYYPLSTLIECGIRDIAVVIRSANYSAFMAALGFGAQWGVKIEYFFQEQPRGIADAFLVTESFIGRDTVALILGDNIFLGADAIPQAVEKFHSLAGAAIFGYESSAPERYGVAEFDDGGRVVKIVEKPKVPKSSFVVTGVYLYDNLVVNIAKSLRPSSRGELEITDVNNAYIKAGTMRYVELGAGVQWLDAGTPEDLHWASSLVRGRQRDENRKYGCPSEAAKRRDGITT